MRRFKIFGFLVAGLILSTLLSWTGIFLYWHFRVAREVRIMRTQKSTSIHDLTSEQAVAPTHLRLLGCRGLAGMIAALHSSEEGGFLNAASYLICTEAWSIDHRDHDELSEPLSERLAAWQILPQDTEAVRRRKIDLMWAWWRGHVPAHPWWRVWTDECLRPKR